MNEFLKKLQDKKYYVGIKIQSGCYIRDKPNLEITIDILKASVKDIEWINENIKNQKEFNNCELIQIARNC